MTRKPGRYVCIHGHFYQPPRENPWTERIDVEPTAAPFHDWNERITAECYAPNAAARILGGDGKVVARVNNYASMSYNFGPTLLSWLERHAADTYKAILAADAESSRRFSNHGSAMAQAYSHAILPLASEADKDLQVVWGLRDFERRFGRRPEGMWLPETAVDVESLEALARYDIGFTVLAPHQARRVWSADKGRWHDVPAGSIDTTKAYRCVLPSGRTVALFFYEGPTSRAIAFEKLLANGETFARRLIAIFHGDLGRPQLASVATDGETYGHHHKFGDMGLAFATRLIEESAEVRLTNFAEFLDRHPPRDLVEIAPATSWSCAHGIERWRSNCGCATGPHRGWSQEWRGPLRSALDVVRDGTSDLYERLAPSFFGDPARALLESVDLAPPARPSVVSVFLEQHAGRALDSSGRDRARRLLEMRRQAVLMQASCAYFFEDIAGLEPVQVLSHAARAMALCRELGGPDLEAPFLDHLGRARGNRRALPDGRVVYDKLVRPKAAAR